ncbi:MAG: hypothetical protein U0787_03260 [Polyangia bacterium]
MADNRCGCYSDADCGGRTCDLGSLTCPSPKTDLSVVVIPLSHAVAAGFDRGVYSVQITDSKVDPVTNANIITQLPLGITGASWTCTAVGAGAMCPAPSGQGPLPSTVSLPAGGQLIYTLSVPVPQGYTSETVPLRDGTAARRIGRSASQQQRGLWRSGRIWPQTTQPDLVLTVDGQLDRNRTAFSTPQTPRTREPEPLVAHSLATPHRKDRR